jgi:TolB-like protein/DNA-binding winged helix-turn-helix (wHTH) protein
MPGIWSPQGDIHFGAFEVHVRARELRKRGSLVRLQQQPFELLLALLERPGDVVSREELRQKLWPADVNVDFDRNLNKAVVKLREALGDSSESPLYVETLPRVGYRFIAPVNGTPVAEPATTNHPASPAIVATEEITTFAVEPSSEMPDRPAVLASSRSRARVLLGLGAILLFTLGVATARMAVRRESALRPIKSLAVLPLENLSGDPGQDYFAAGMTDELTTMLAKNSTLRIVSRTSVMQYKGAHGPLAEIARNLGVDGILEGSVARSGDQIHMTIQLIQAPSDTHVWAESYDRNANDVVSLPREAAQTVAKQLKSAVPEAVSPRFVLPAAHDAYLRGRYIWYTEDNEKAGEYFRKATELQPDFALGWSGLSVYYAGGAIEGRLDPRQSLAQAEATAVKAVELDERLPEGHLALGAAILINDWDWDRAQREVARAIELDPKFAEAYHLRARVLAAINRHPEAIEAQQQATELDPFARSWALILSYTFARQYDAAIADALQRLESNPSDINLHAFLSSAYRRKGMGKEAAQELEKRLSLGGEEESAVAVRRAFEHAGYRGVIDWQLSQLKKKAATRYVSPVDMANCYAQLGEREETLALLEEGYRLRAPQLLWMQADPAYDFLHSEERYRSIIKRMGLPPAY